nr:metal-sensing transcriptional repressor [uncultured Romboutsia sp.]
MNEDRKKALRMLNICKGQIEGIIRMIEDDRYCVDISTQILASQSLLKKSNILIFRQHIDNCIRNISSDEDIEPKINELSDIINKALK